MFLSIEKGSEVSGFGNKRDYPEHWLAGWQAGNRQLVFIIKFEM